MSFGKHDKMDLCGGTFRREHNNFIVLVDNVLNRLLALDNLVKWRVTQLVKRDLCLLNLLLNLAFLWFRPPLSNRKNRACLAELREDKIGVFIESLQFLTKSASQSKRFNLNLKQEHVLTGSDELGEVCYGADKLL